MQVFLNGEPKDIANGLTVAALVESLRLDGRKVAIERNLEIVPKSLYAEVTLAEDDRIEIVHFIGGG
jgi:thiamine biosynthesis protein ThiS